MICDVRCFFFACFRVKVRKDDSCVLIELNKGNRFPASDRVDSCPYYVFMLENRCIFYSFAGSSELRVD